MPIVRLEWGEQGLEAILPHCTTIVVVDVLRFTTAVEVAVSSGAGGRCADGRRTRCKSNRAANGRGSLPIADQNPPDRTGAIPELRTERLLLRGWRQEDAEPFARINADPNVARYLRGRPETREETAALISSIAEHWAGWGYGLWAVERRSDARFIGFIGFSHHRWYPDEVEIGWRLDPTCWGRGLATEGAQAALNHGLDRLAVDRVISVIHRDNTASRRVAEKIGLRVWQETAFAHPDWPEPIPIVVYAS